MSGREHSAGATTHGLDLIRDAERRLAHSALALGALGAALALRGGAAGPVPAAAAAVVARLDAVLDALGVRMAVATTPLGALGPLLADARATLLQAVALLEAPERRPAWTHTDAALLESQGESSAGLAIQIARAVVPTLEGLAGRLAAPGAAVLDVGVGVAALAAALAQAFPAARVVGVDPHGPALALARRRIAAAALGDRIALRQHGVEALADAACYDLAWVPAGFLAGTVRPLALARVWAALRPGGWLLLGTPNPAGDPLAAALAHLQTVLRGGEPLEVAAAEALLAAAGYEAVHVVPAAPAAATSLIAGRRPTT